MKRCVMLMLVVFLVAACDDDSSTDGNVCDTLDPNPCVEQNRGACIPEDDAQYPDGWRCECEEGTEMTAPLCCDDAEPGPDCDCTLTLCCHEGEVVVDVACVCPEGTEWSEENQRCDEITVEACSPNPCDEAVYGPHMTACAGDGQGGFTCSCDVGYQQTTDGGCEPELVEICPGDDQCLGGWCVPGIGDGQCIDDSDCHENLSAVDGNPTFCNSAPFGGICIGCSGFDADECPTGFSCTEYNTCAKVCSSSDECPHGTCNTTMGFCVQATCVSDSECPDGAICFDEDGDGSGMCQRIPCLETLGSPYNPGGACDTGEACIDGACYGSCAPENPCVELNRTNCVETAQGPECHCDEGYAEDANGDCMPEACPTGFSCQDGYCVDPGELFQCVVDADCGGSLTCSPSLPTGTCSGCTDAVDCPDGFDTCLSGYCLRSCTTSGDCAAGMECNGLGYCGKLNCTAESDCQPGYTCAPGDPGRCERITCN